MLVLSLVLRIGNSAIRYRHRPLPGAFNCAYRALKFDIQPGLFASVASVQEAGIGHLPFHAA
jgi:hypothetical protein